MPTDDGLATEDRGVRRDPREQIVLAPSHVLIHTPTKSYRTSRTFRSSDGSRQGLSGSSRVGGACVERADDNTQTVLFADLVDRRLGLLAALTATVPDARASARVTHGVGDLLAQRVFAIACGHPDGNDADRLADDPIHKLLLGRDPIDGGRLASQPTISRFEHTAAPRMLLAMRAALADTVIARHRRRRRGVRLITIDLDVTDDQTHGAQQLTFFNGFYDHWCYLPLVGTLTFDDEAIVSHTR